jgi:aldehyde:ferredoxin oxidoreductase
MFGWVGTILRIDLSKKKVKMQSLPKELAVKFIGGAGINAKILYDEVGPEVDPFHPENRLIYGAGLLTGTLAPSSARFSVTGKGPLTFAFSDSNSGGHFGPEMKFAGYDHIVIYGASDKPVYLWIDNDHIEFRDATHLWGKNVWETDKIIKDELKDPDVKISIIGPAGENLVRYSAPINEHARAAGWGGFGAIMGSKKLKAIAIRGTGGVQIANPSKFERICLKMQESIQASTRMQDIGFFGMPWLNWLYNDIKGANPVKNYQVIKVPSDIFPNVDHFNFMKLVKKWKGCFNCSFSCSHYIQVQSGIWAGASGEGFEYNHMIDGQMMGIFDPSFYAAWCFETNKLGIDCDGPASAIAWAMECYEKGIISRKDVDGVELTWGNQKAAIEMLHKIAYREGFGDLLAEGVQIASKRIGRGSEKFAYHVKGSRLWIDPRISWDTALCHAVSTRGADHLKGMPMSNAFTKWKGIKPENLRTALSRYKIESSAKFKFIAELIIFTENLYLLIDSLGLCKNSSQAVCDEGPGLNEFAEMVSSATGIEFTPEKLLLAGERGYNIERAYNAAHKLSRKDDTFHQERFFNQKIDTKLGILDKKKFEKLKTRYYELRGWNTKTGNPTKEKLEKLEIENVGEFVPTNTLLD